ncbi:hypothetical protein [Aeromicrobium sp. CF3.5]|uniref:hypothetical protein n=1 Tax=Aeromicrobium sp. CF3.5 TaxID=3373078 RepID=UPI003EE7A5CE
MVRLRLGPRGHDGAEQAAATRVPSVIAWVLPDVEPPSLVNGGEARGRVTHLVDVENPDIARQGPHGRGDT